MESVLCSTSTTYLLYSVDATFSQTMDEYAWSRGVWHAARYGDNARFVVWWYVVYDREHSKRIHINLATYSYVVGLNPCWAGTQRTLR